MDTLIMTLSVAFVVTLAALALMGISWLLTGKLKMKPGACGRAPTKNKSDEEGCGTNVSCTLCKKNEKKT